MNQIPNIEEVKEIRKTITDALDKHEYIASWVDIGIERICDIYEKTHHQQLQKAREEEREQKANELQEMLDGPYSQAIYSWRPDNYVSFIRKTHHSELDQDKV